MALTPQQVEDFWKIADRNNDGQLTVGELQRAVKKYNNNISDAQIAGMFYGIDDDGDKRISKREFQTDMIEKQKRSAGMDQLFKKHDKDNSKTLSRGELIQMVKDTYPPEDVDSVVGEFLNYSDKDGNGQISYQEFKQFFG